MNDMPSAGTQLPDESLFDSTFDPEMLDRGLRGLGIHPHDLLTLLRYAPLALTQMCWRNSVIEDWHAGRGSRINDAEMMRANVATTRLFQQTLWDAFGEQLANATLVSRADLTDEDVEPLASAFKNVLDEAFTAARQLPHGPTLGALGRDELGELYDHADTQLAALVGQAQRHGVAVVLMWLGMRGRIGCNDWFGSPRWPRIVDAFLARLDDPDDEFWIRCDGPARLPADMEDRAVLRHQLLSAPDLLSTQAVDFCLHRAGLGFVRVDD